MLFFNFANNYISWQLSAIHGRCKLTEVRKWGYKEEVKTKTVKYTWNKCGVCQAAHEQLRVKNSRGGSWESTVLLPLSFSPSHETSYSFQNTEVSWSLPLPRPPESSGRNAPSLLSSSIRTRVFSPSSTFRLFHAAAPVFCFRLFRTITAWRAPRRHSRSEWIKFTARARLLHHSWNEEFTATNHFRRIKSWQSAIIIQITRLLV